MSEDRMRPGRSDDLSADSSSGRETDLGGTGSRRDHEDKPHRVFGSATPGAGGNPYSAEDANADADATGPSEGTPEDLKPGGERAVGTELGADAGDDGRETSP